VHVGLVRHSSVSTYEEGLSAHLAGNTLRHSVDDTTHNVERHSNGDDGNPRQPNGRPCQGPLGRVNWLVELGVQAAPRVLLVEEAIKATVLVRWLGRHDDLEVFLNTLRGIYIKIFFNFL